ncbi:MAG: sigma factor [Pseudonocardiaceae bacterium]
MFKFDVHVLGDEGLAEEMAQGTIVKFCRRAGSYDSARGPVRAWLFTTPTTSPGVPPPGRSCPSGFPAAGPHARPARRLRCAGPTTGDAIRERILDAGRR